MEIERKSSHEHTGRGAKLFAFASAFHADKKRFVLIGELRERVGERREEDDVFRSFGGLREFVERVEIDVDVDLQFASFSRARGRFVGERRGVDGDSAEQVVEIFVRFPNRAAFFALLFQTGKIEERRLFLRKLFAAIRQIERVFEQAQRSAVEDDVVRVEEQIDVSFGFDKFRARQFAHIEVERSNERRLFLRVFFFGQLEKDRFRSAVGKQNRRRFAVLNAQSCGKRRITRENRVERLREPPSVDFVGGKDEFVRAVVRGPARVRDAFEINAVLTVGKRSFVQYFKGI